MLARLEEIPAQFFFRAMPTPIYSAAGESLPEVRLAASTWYGVVSDTRSDHFRRSRQVGENHFDNFGLR